MTRFLRFAGFSRLLADKFLDSASLPRPHSGMRFFRILLALLIAFALPAQALADARMAVGCCPMAATDMQETMASGHDCCHEHDTNSAGKHCDAGFGCYCSIHLALAIHDFPPPAPLERASFLADLPAQPHPAPSTQHWRPPAPLTALI